MPKVVDVVERRSTIVDAVLQVVAEHGVEGVTVRAVAQQAGLSAGLLHHYFPSGKAELLHAAVTSAVDRGTERMLAALDDARGLAALRAVAWELLPVVPQRRAEWAAWVGLWGQVLTDPDLRREQAERLDAWRALLAALLAQAVEDGELPTGLDTEGAAVRLAAALDGLGLHALVQPDLLPPDRLRREVDALLSAAASA